jgi:hypothetical protein
MSFNDSDWAKGQGGFGDPKDYNPVIRTEWTTEQVWLRKKFNFSGENNGKIIFKVYNQFEAETVVYLNGELVAKAPEHSNSYTIIELEANAKLLLKNGENIVAVHCTQNNRRAYFDLGMYFLKNPE